MDEKYLQSLIIREVDSRIKELLKNVEKNTQRILSALADAKFSEFSIASTPYNGTEKWVGLQNGINVQGNLSVGGFYLPELNIIQGLTSASIVIDEGDPVTSYSGFAGSVVYSSVKLEIKSDGSGDQCQLVIANPVTSNFTKLGQAKILGSPSIVKTPGGVGNNGSGWNGNLTADIPTGGILFSFEVSELNTTYFIDVSWSSRIQSPSLIKGKK